MLSLIYAMSLNRTLGKNYQLPWKVKGELARFKKKTWGHPVLMGRKTFESLGKPLEGRTNYVLSRTPKNSLAGAKVLHEIAEVKILHPDEEIFVIGGSEIFRQCLPLCGRIYQSLILQNFEGDVFMPEFNENKFIIRYQELIESNINYLYTVFAKK